MLSCRPSSPPWTSPFSLRRLLLRQRPSADICVFLQKYLYLHRPISGPTAQLSLQLFLPQAPGFRPPPPPSPVLPPPPSPPLSVLRVLRVAHVLVLGAQVGCRGLAWGRCRYSYICYAAFLATAGREEHSRDRFARMVLGCVCACVACVSARAKLLFDLNKSSSTGRQQIQGKM